MKRNYKVSARIELGISKNDAPLDLSDLEARKMEIAGWIANEYRSIGRDFVDWCVEQRMKGNEDFKRYYDALPAQSIRLPNVVVLGILDNGTSNE